MVFGYIYQVLFWPRRSSPMHPSQEKPEWKTAAKPPTQKPKTVSEKYAYLFLLYVCGFIVASVLYDKTDQSKSPGWLVALPSEVACYISLQ
jgi:hypothetical protein